MILLLRSSLLLSDERNNLINPVSMRIALILLALTALLFIGGIAYSIVGKNPTLFQKTGSVNTETPLAIETLKYQIKTEEKINELNKKIDALTQAQGISPVQIGSQASPVSSTSTGVTTLTEQKLIPVSGKFLARIMPTYELVNIKNNGIYDLHIFDKIDYSTYTDIKAGLTVVVTPLSYDTLLKNFKALDKTLYVPNETKTFSFRSFYVNPPKADALVRIVVEIESQAILISIPKTKFPQLKNLLIK